MTIDRLGMATVKMAEGQPHHQHNLAPKLKPEFVAALAELENAHKTYGSNSAQVKACGEKAQLFLLDNEKMYEPDDDSASTNPHSQSKDNPKQDMKAAHQTPEPRS
ncbi:uncharacterized protein KY384_007838 [Bacidia gigantensis]|uniref:uncharacterized protein n=1 Tax=Bacidia gigantensis TaxID=2732470 RepID=UPI001D0380CB|nr:uncharacterized protein KY384_007838 [Bacidia gigantensis]KAG8527684.1 hypothetical protein KY384_007838 [Bacidia gigantensis]